MNEQLNYKIGLIFIDDEDYSNKSSWCNKNGCYIEEIEKDDEGNRQFQITEILAPTADELAKQVRAKRDLLLDQTDYLMMPDYPVRPEYLSRIKEYRQELRDITKQENFPQRVVFPDFPKIE